MFHTSRQAPRKYGFNAIVLYTALALFTVLTFVLPISAAAQSLQAHAAKPQEDQTIVVSPVPGSPKASGKALITATKKARLTMASAKSQHLTILLEPGVYDIGDEALHLIDGADLEGSGINQTEIVGLGQSFAGSEFSFDEGVVMGSDNTTLRHLTVRCVNTAELDACIAMANYQVSPHIQNVRFVATSPEGGHWGLRNFDSSPLLSDVEIVVANGTSNYGVVNVSPNSRPEIRGTTITAADGSVDNIGILNKQEALPTRLDDVEISVSSGGRAIGMLNMNAADLAVTGPKSAALPILRVINTEIAALDAVQSIGFSNGAFELQMRQSLVVSDTSAIDLGPLSNVDVASSQLEASRFFVHANDVRIAGSTLLGGAQVAAYGNAVCTGTRTEAGVVDACP